MIRTTILSLLFLLCFTAQAQQILIKYEGEKLSRKDSLKIDKISSYEIEFYKQIFTFDSLLLKYRVFATKDAYVKFLAEHKIKMHDRRFIAKYAKKINTCLIFRNEKADDDVFWGSVSFCTSSALIHQQKGSNQAWLSTGLNQYFKFMDVGRKSFTHQLPVVYIAKLKSMIEMKDLNLEEFISSKNKEFLKQQLTDESSAYALSHALVYFLIEKDFSKFKELVRSIKAGQSSYEAINSNYLGGFSAFNIDFQKYIMDK